MYVIIMRTTRQYGQGEYTFSTKKECRKFLETLTDYEIDNIISIDKYSKHSSRPAWYDFFNN